MMSGGRGPPLALSKMMNQTNSSPRGLATPKSPKSLKSKGNNALARLSSPSESNGNGGVNASSYHMIMPIIGVQDAMIPV